MASVVGHDMCFMVFAGVSDYKQSLQFQNLNEEKYNIQMEVGLVQCINSPHLKFIPSTHV